MQRLWHVCEAPSYGHVGLGQQEDGRERSCRFGEVLCVGAVVLVVEHALAGLSWGAGESHCRRCGGGWRCGSGACLSHRGGGCDDGVL
jgi:hypothetical protein